MFSFESRCRDYHKTYLIDWAFVYHRERKMKRETIVGFVSAVLFLFSMLSINAHLEAVDSYSIPRVFGAQSTADPTDWWPMFHHDLGHSGYSTSTGPTANRTLWKYTTGNGVHGACPAVVGGVVYIGSSDYNFYALNATTGALIWKYTAGNGFGDCPAVAGGVVYIGSDDYNVYALNATTGALIWKYTTGFWVESSPAVANGIVYVGSLDHSVYALNATTGALIWKYTTGNYVYSAPAVANGIVYVGSNDHNVYALNATTGAIIWKYTTGNAVMSSPAVAGGVVYIGSDDDDLYALSATTGALIWKYAAGSAVYSAPAVANGTVYVGSDDYNVYALNATTGAIIWKYTTGLYVYSCPAVAGGVVYVGSQDDDLYALNATTGALIWKYKTGSDVYSSPAVANGFVYVGSGDDNVYAFGSLPTSTTITLSVSLAYVGSAVNCTATVSGVNAGTSASGTVTWSTSSSTGHFSTPVCTLSSGSCYTIYNDSFPGSVTIAAYYSGDSNYQPSSGSVTLTVVSRGPIYYSQNYSSVQAAINASTPGSNVIVAAGNYHEFLILNKRLTIIGDIDQAGFGGGGSGIYLTVLSGASGTIVTGFEITSYDEGILVYASNCKIYSNTMSSIGEDGVALDGSSATGDAVYDNMFQNTPTAINLTDSAGGNTIYGNIISSQAAVTLNVGTNDNTVYENVISGSSIILNMTSSTGNTFYHDDFLATVQIVAGGANTWDNGYPSGGNYWSDYQTKYPDAAEIDSSGIWNTPYVINGNNKDNYPLMNPYAPSVGHDVAVTIVVSAKTVIMQGYTGNVTVTAFNEGQYAENFTVTLYANTTVIGTQQVSNLSSVGQITLTFTWNTTGSAMGKYTISAYAEPVQGETNVADNNFTDGLIYVSMVGDLTGTKPFVPDGKCDGRDITIVAKCFGSKLGDPNYNPNCDLYNRGKIDGKDITIVAKNFGKQDPTWPPWL
jgi:outer membrane protein assembly factor BamB